MLSYVKMHPLFLFLWLLTASASVINSSTHSISSSVKSSHHSQPQIELEAEFNTTLVNLASPLKARGTLKARQCQWDAFSREWVCDFDLPTMSEFLQRLHDVQDHGRVTAENSAWFYTNLKTYQTTRLEGLLWSVAWLDDNVVDYYSIFDGVNQAWLNEQKEFVRNNGAFIEDGIFDVGHPASDNGKEAGKEAYDELTRCYNQAVASAAIHPDAYIFTLKDTDWHPGSIWAQIELPALTQNENIQRIWRIVEEEGGCGDKVLYWERQRDPIIEYGRKCLLTNR